MARRPFRRRIGLAGDSRPDRTGTGCRDRDSKANDQHRGQRLNDGRIFGIEILIVARPEVDSTAALDRFGAKAIQFQFVGPGRSLRQHLAPLQEHGFDEAGVDFQA